MDKNGKSRHSVWLSDEVWQEVDAFYKLDNCPTRNEFVEKALRQYCGRLHAERTSAYLPRALQEMLEGTLGVFGDRLGKLLFKLVVEHNMTNHLLGGDIDMTRDEYNKMRGTRQVGWSTAMWPAAAPPSSPYWSACGRTRSWTRCTSVWIMTRRVRMLATVCWIPWRIWATMWSVCARRGRTGTMTCGQSGAKRKPRQHKAVGVNSFIQHQLPIQRLLF